jgi:hypothetical protein
MNRESEHQHGKADSHPELGEHAAERPRNVLRVILMVLLAAGTLAAAAGVVDPAIERIGLGKVMQANRRYLDNSMDKAVTGFLILSGIKSGLAVIEGSEVGIGFNLEIGDIVQSVYDYVDIAWKAALAGGTVVLMTRLALQAAEMIDNWCLALTFAAALLTVAISWLPPGRRRFGGLFREGLFFLAVATLVFYLVFPLSITGAALLSEKISGPLILESNRSFDSLREEFSPENLNRRFFPETGQDDEGWVSQLLSGEKLKRLKEHLRQQAAYFKEKSKDVALWTLQLIAGYLFDSIVFPATFFILLFVIVKGALRYFFEDRRQRQLTNEIAAAVAVRAGSGDGSGKRRPARSGSEPRSRRFPRRRMRIRR